MLGYETEVVNGQMVNVAPRAAYNPLIFGQMYTAPGMWQRQGVYNIPPVLPSAAQMGDAAPASYGGTFPTPASETGNPFHLTKSPLWWTLGFLVLSLVGLYFIVYRKD